MAYTTEHLTYLQQHLEFARANILRELDLLQKKAPATYAELPFFCIEACAGRIIADSVVLHMKELLPCGCFYGATAHHDFTRASELIDTMRLRITDDRDLTPIESYLMDCQRVEDRRRGHYVQEPIPWENPGLQALVALIEEHVAHSTGSTIEKTVTLPL